MTVAGAGIEGTVQGRRYRIGTPQFVTAWHRDGAATLAPAAADVTLVTLGDATRVLMQFELADELRERVPDAIDALRRHGVVASILSGDRRSSVDAVADACGITKRFAAYSPERKLAHLQSLQQQGHRVLMLGDGVNDAPVLAAADVSIAMGRGTALAHASADMILTTEDLNAVPQAIAVARRMRRIARQNLCWAAAWNFGSLPLAALGFIPPWAAALGMSLSSILVVMNATRLLPRESDDGCKATATRSAPSLAPSIIVARGVSS
jgi:Cu2+-exporting ATPase